jgi:hypothetical protein
MEQTKKTPEMISEKNSVACRKKGKRRCRQTIIGEAPNK